jgi:hypothetical protein
MFGKSRPSERTLERSFGAVGQALKAFTAEVKKAKAGKVDGDALLAAGADASKKIQAMRAEVNAVNATAAAACALFDECIEQAKLATSDKPQ